MEVHHHSHTERKKWKHYFWEFLMLFLAVYLGILAENFREHQIERKREKEFIYSIIEDLKEDTASFRRVITWNDKACEKIDTLIHLLKGNPRDVSAKKIYYLARLIPLNDITLVCQNKTFEQLKGSGGLRLIHDLETQNKIGDYYQINKLIEEGPSPMQYQNRRDLFLSYDQLFDAELMQFIMTPSDEVTVIPEDKRFKLLSNDPEIINKFCFRYHFIYSTKKVVTMQVKGFIDRATALLVYLQNEYLKK